MNTETTNTAVPAPKCRHCGAALHDGQCPRVKSIEYYPDGTEKKVEYKQERKSVTEETTYLRVRYPRRRHRRLTLGEWIFGC